MNVFVIVILINYILLIFRLIVYLFYYQYLLILFQIILYYMYVRLLITSGGDNILTSWG